MMAADGVLNGRVALVTGAGSGIGRAAAELFAERGAAVVAADLNESGADTVAGIAQSGGQATFVRGDVSIESDVKAMVETAESTYGGLDMAFNNAGIAGPVVALEDLELEGWERVLAINLRSTWLCMKHELAVMVPRKRGAIVNTSSAAGLVGAPLTAPYSASKGGVIGLTRAAAVEHGRNGIRVNAIAPGIIRTGMIEEVMAERGPEAVDQAAAAVPLGRIGESRETAEAAVWLCSPASSFVTGQVLAVDGGLTAQ